MAIRQMTVGAAIVRDAERVEVLRQRLSSLSWFMAELDEHLARRANANPTTPA